MADEDAREIDRIPDGRDSVVIVGIDHDQVTLRTPRHGLIAAFPSYRAEEFARAFVSACWQAGWHQGRAGQDGGT